MATHSAPENMALSRPDHDGAAPENQFAQLLEEWAPAVSNWNTSVALSLMQSCMAELLDDDESGHPTTGVCSSALTTPQYRG